MYPRSVSAVPYSSRVKKGSTTTPSTNLLGGINLSTNVPRTPSRKFYSPETTTSAVYLPKTIRDKNRWRRWFYDHDPIVGSVLDTHAFLPHSEAEVVCPDIKIRRHYEDMLQDMKFFSKLPMVDLEYLKIGEVFIWMYFDEKKGYWTHTIVHNPDFIEVKGSPFALDDPIVEIKPDNELKKIIHSTDPREIQLRRKIPRDILQKLMFGQNIPVKGFNMTHLKRTSSPYDLRGTSILDRLFRILMYEDKIREANITIADNYIFPLKIFKLGDPKQKWIPNETHQNALAELLQQAQMDPNFSIIYHYGLQYEIHGYEGRVIKLNQEYEDIDKLKMIALGVNKAFVFGETTYSSANAGLQVLLGTYRAKRDMFEHEWIYPKIFKPVAELNEFYEISKAELSHRIRIKRHGKEKEERLMVPTLDWHKKLMIRDDQQYLQWLSTLYSRGQGPISTTTLLRSAGIDHEQELRNRKEEKKLEMQYGVEFLPQPATPGLGGPPGLGPIAGDKGFRKKLGNLFKRFGNKNKIAKEEINVMLKATNDEQKNGNVAGTKKVANTLFATPDREDLLTGTANKRKEGVDMLQGISNGEVEEAKQEVAVPDLIDYNVWGLKLGKIGALPHKFTEAALLFEKEVSDAWDEIALKTERDTQFLEDQKLVFSRIDQNVNTLKDILKESFSTFCRNIYTQGKFYSYDQTRYTDVKVKYALSVADHLPENLAIDRFVDEFSLETLTNFFEKNLQSINNVNFKEAKNYLTKSIRDALYATFLVASLRGYEEQGITSVRVRFASPCKNCARINEHILKIDHLLSLEKEISNFLHAACAPYLAPEITNSEDPSTVDESLEVMRNLKVGNLEAKDVPIEYMGQVSNLLSRLYSINSDILQKTSIRFSKNITGESIWIKEAKEKYPELNDDSKDIQLREAMVNKERREFSGNSYLTKDRELLISTDIGIREIPIEDALLDELMPIIHEAYKDKISNFEYKNGSFGCIQSGELNDLKAADILVSLSTTEDIGWKVNSKLPDFNKTLDSLKISESSKSLIRYGKASNYIWNKEGRLITDVVKSNDPESAFKEFFRMYVREPDKLAFLDKEIFASLNGLFKK